MSQVCRIVYLEDAKYRWDLRLIPELRRYTLAKYGSQRIWECRQCRLSNPQDAIADIRSQLNQYKHVEVLSIDAQLSQSDHEQLRGLKEVYAELLKSPGILWSGVAFMSEHFHGLYPNVISRIHETVDRLHRQYSASVPVFKGAPTSVPDVDRFVEWANALVDNAQPG